MQNCIFTLDDVAGGQAYVDVEQFVDKNQHLNVNLNKQGYIYHLTYHLNPALK